MINLVVITTTQSLHLENWASFPQAETTSDTRSSLLSTTESKNFFTEWIWLGNSYVNIGEWHSIRQIHQSIPSPEFCAIRLGLSLMCRHNFENYRQQF